MYSTDLNWNPFSYITGQLQAARQTVISQCPMLSFEYLIGIYMPLSDQIYYFGLHFQLTTIGPEHFYTGIEIHFTRLKSWR